MRKPVSRRHWKKRWLKGLWLPTVVLRAYKLSPPDGYIEQPHPALKHIARYVDDLEDQLEYMKDIGVAVHKYVTGYSRMRVALLILAGDTPLSDKIDTLDLAKRFAAEAVKFTDED